MKRIFLFSTFLFQLIIVFGQTKTESKKSTIGMATGGYKPNVQETPPTNNPINYNDRPYQNDCYKSFAFTVKNYGYNKNGKFYSWGVKVTNNYPKAVQLKYKLIVGNDNNQNGTLTYYIKPGETYSNDFGTAKAIIVNNNSDQYKIEVSEVCFEGQDCNKNGYVDCNGRQKSNMIEVPQNGIKEKISKDGKTKFIIEYKDGNAINEKKYKEGVLERLSIYDLKGNVIESTDYYSSGEIYCHTLCENKSCHAKWYDRSGNITNEHTYTPLDWTN